MGTLRASFHSHRRIFGGDQRSSVRRQSFNLILDRMGPAPRALFPDWAFNSHTLIPGHFTVFFATHHSLQAALLPNHLVASPVAYWKKLLRRSTTTTHLPERLSTTSTPDLTLTSSSRSHRLTRRRVFSPSPSWCSTWKWRLCPMRFRTVDRPPAPLRI